MKRVLNVKHYQDPYLRTDIVEGFPGGSVVKNLLAHAGDIGSIPDQGRSHKQWNNKTRAQLLSLCSRARALKDDTTMRRSPCTANRPMDCSLPASSVHEIFQAVGCHFLLQRIFPTQVSCPAGDSLPTELSERPIE